MVQSWVLHSRMQGLGCIFVAAASYTPTPGAMHGLPHILEQYTTSSLSLSDVATSHTHVIATNQLDVFLLRSRLMALCVACCPSCLHWLLLAAAAERQRQQQQEEQRRKQEAAAVAAKAAAEVSCINACG
jgi:hypothetical protein